MGFRKRKSRYVDSNRKFKYPLKRIVREGVSPEGVLMEYLECGHSIHTPQDFIGYTNAVRRRCKKCFEEALENNGGNIHISPATV